MVDVFISYSRANKARVADLAKAIEAAGYHVWWDAELPPHQSYGDVITAKIESAKAALVVWSKEAAASEWVRAEADLARNHKKLIQTGLGNIIPPLPFNQIQMADLTDWKGEDDHPEWRKVKASLEALCGPPAAVASEAVSADVAPEAAAAPAIGVPAADFPRPPSRPAPNPVPAQAAGAQPGSGVPKIIMACLAFVGLICLIGIWQLVSPGGDDNARTPAALVGPAVAPAVVQPAPPAPGAAPVQPPEAQPSDPQPAEQNRDVRILNNSGETVMYLFWSDTSRSDWGQDRLGNDTLANGSIWETTIDDGNGACNFDIRAVTQSGRDIILNAVNVCSVYDIDLR